MPTFMSCSRSALSSVPGNLALRRNYDPFRAKSELLQQLLKRCRSSKGFDTDVVPLGTGVFAPAKIRCFLDRHSCLHVWRQNRFPVIPILIIEQFPRRHTDHACPNTLLAQLFVGLQTEGNLAAGPDEDDLRVGARSIRENVGPA